MLRLILLRHAKSTWDDPSLLDHDRPLTSRGRKAATRIGDYLREQGTQPDLVLCSSSVRTRQTLVHLHLDSGIETVFDDALYRASANDMMKYLGRTGDGALSVLLIGHNPGISDLVGMLTTEPERVGPISAVGLDGRYTAPLPDAESKHASSLPTAGLADLRFMIPSWSDIQPGTAVLDHIVMPRNLV